MSDFTLQINLSAGDARYAEFTVPRLLAAHPAATERLLIVDLCKPQATGIVDPARRYPEPGFSERLARVTALAEGWHARGQVDRVVFLRPDDPLFPQLRRTYLRPWVQGTHDYGGCALLSYLAAFELCQTRWLLHYDADMILHQEPGFDWAVAAQAAVAADPSLVAAIPRPSPPLPERPDLPSRNEQLAMHPHPAGWRSGWFSTRCYLFDLERLRPCLPLLQGRTYWDSLAARWLRRGFPRAPEGLLFHRLGAAGLSRLTLGDPRAWLLHPTQKDDAFVRALPRLLALAAGGVCPTGQRGQQDVMLGEWSALLA